MPAEPPLTHFDPHGQAHMVDVAGKDESHRVARARGTIRMHAATLALIASGQAGKGDVLGIARIAAIQATKRTAELIPLCHPLRVTGVDLALRARRDRVTITARVRAFDRTGVEMEALTAVAVAALTVYDMCKAIDRGMRIEDVRLDEKRGGKSGTWRRPRATRRA